MQQTKQVLLSQELYDLFKNHIGLENGLTKHQILKKIYSTSDNFLQSYYDWNHKVAPCFRQLRRDTKMFIVSGELFSKRVYFVLQSEQELEWFKRRNIKQMKGLKGSNMKANKAVREEWWKEL